MKKITMLIYAAVMLFSMASRSDADITFTDLGGGNYGVELTALLFDVDVGSTQPMVVIDNFYLASNGLSGTYVSGNAEISINGAPSTPVNFNSFVGSFNGSYGQINNTDLLFNYSGAYSLGPVSPGDTFTISTSNLIFNNPSLAPISPGPDFTAQLVDAFDGSSLGTAMVSFSSVPEPTSLPFLALACVFSIRRRRKA